MGFYFFVGGLLLSGAAFGAGAGRSVFVSEAPQGVVNQYYERIPLGGKDIVFNSKPIGRETRRIFEPTGSQLWVGHLAKSDVKPLRGEIGRHGPLALVLVKEGRHPHAGDLPVLWMKVDRSENVFRPYPSVDLRPLQEMSLRSRSPLRRRGVTVDPDFLREKLSEFSGAKSVVVGGQTVFIKERGSVSGRNLARAYLAQEYDRIGYKVGTHVYSPDSAANFVAQKRGENSEKFVILSSHFDSVGNPGADDDGSGTIAALAVAHALSKAKINMDLRVLAFDEEEKGLIGAKAYARDLDKSGEMKGLVGVFHLEMNGFHRKGDGGFHVIDCNQNTSAHLSKFILDAVVKHGIPLKRVDACTSASDHSVFWKYGKPAIVTSENFFGGDGNNCYHKACDTVEQLNFQYMARVAEANANALAAFLNAQ